MKKRRAPCKRKMGNKLVSYWITYCTNTEQIFIWIGKQFLLWRQVKIRFPSWWRNSHCLWKNAKYLCFTALREWCFLFFIFLVMLSFYFTCVSKVILHFSCSSWFIWVAYQILLCLYSSVTCMSLFFSPYPSSQH